MYGKHKWLARSDYVVTCPTAIMANTMQTRAARLQQYLYDLEDWGLVESVQWHPNWFQVQLKPIEGTQPEVLSV